MSFDSCYEKSPVILMEGALGERLKREYNFRYDDNVALANIIYRSGGKKALCELWNQYIDVAKNYNFPFIATTPTRRANKARVLKAGFDKSIILDNVSFLKEIQKAADVEMYIGGLMGCKGDAYKATEVLSPDEAHKFHSWQADLFMQAGVDFLFAGIMPALSEALGIAKAMEETNLPYIISFMIRPDGRLLDGTAIHNAIFQIDNSVNRKPVCYMANCVHPTVLFEALSQTFNKTELIRERFKGIQANSSPLSPEELDASVDLKCSDPELLADGMIRLRDIVNIKIFGGCCGTDKTHMNAIASRL